VEAEARSETGRDADRQGLGDVGDTEKYLLRVEEDEIAGMLLSIRGDGGR